MDITIPVTGSVVDAVVAVTAISVTETNTVASTIPEPDIITSTPNNVLKLVYSNVQSIFNKKSEIELYIKENNPDMLMLTECFMTLDHHSSEYNFDGYHCFVHMKNRGGACIYVKNNFSCYEIFLPNKMEDLC